MTKKKKTGELGGGLVFMRLIFMCHGCVVVGNGGSQEPRYLTLSQIRPAPPHPLGVLSSVISLWSMLVLPSLRYHFFRWSFFGFGFWECLMRRRIGRIGSKWGSNGRPEQAAVL